MHNEAYRLLGLDYVYLCFDVLENNLHGLLLKRLREIKCCRL
ncbi:MAG: hypothetical protein ACLUR5_02485 [Eubacterium ventriosum]